MSTNTYIVTTSTAVDAVELTEFCAVRGIPIEKKGLGAILLSASMPEEYLKPTKAMKAFCGPEWANKHGLIQPKAALERVIKTIERNSGIIVSDIVYLPEPVREALATQLTSVLVSDLPDLVKNSFARP
jgi:hypothetical protein